jgi:predicted TIM-barrel fold metal-dependent hydrolase
MSELAEHIQSIRLIDTHEHMCSEQRYVEQGPDLLQSLFDNYVEADLFVAGASEADVKKLLDATNPDLAGRLAAIRPAWERCRHTGYGEAVQLIARLVYGMDEITPEALAGAQPLHTKLRQPGERLRLLRDVAGLDHVQIDNFEVECVPDQSGPSFFLYDLSWVGFCNGTIDLTYVRELSGIAVESLADLKEGITRIYARYGPLAIAVKSQHAYNRTLYWEERDDADVERVLQRVLSSAELSVDEKLCLGDWCMARGVEQAIVHNLPFKIHTGYYAGHSNMPVERIRPGHLCGLLQRYPEARFVLMHAAYPYSAELIALAKHYPNTYIDMCWAWSIDPYSASDTLRRCIHAVPANKIFAFGGDTFWPTGAVAYASQARTWLTRALQAEVDDGLLTERAAIALATRFTRQNQLDCFDIAGRQASIAAALAL